jgi:uncharacterized membrane protein (UPF0127 family)
MPVPRPVAIRNQNRGQTLGERIRVADRWWSRARGLLGKRLGEGEGLLIRPCRAVHMFGMSYPIDVAFLDAGSRVVATYADLRPGRMTRFHRSAETALELPAGQLARTGTCVGDRLTITSTLTEA